MTTATKPETSEVIVHKDGGTTFSGPDAVNLYRAIALKTALNMYARHGMQANRQLTPTVMLVEAGKYTGKVYKRGMYAVAVEDMQVWVDTMKLALPINLK